MASVAFTCALQLRCSRLRRENPRHTDTAAMFCSVLLGLVLSILLFGVVVAGFGSFCCSDDSTLVLTAAWSTKQLN